MAEFAVEIDVIGEDQAFVRQASQGGQRQIDMGHIVGAFHFLAGVAMRENIADLADGDY